MMLLTVMYVFCNNPPSPPNFPPLYLDVWSESLQQYIDWMDSKNPLPTALEYLAYWGTD